MTMVHAQYTGKKSPDYKEYYRRFETLQEFYMNKIFK